MLALIWVVVKIIVPFWIPIIMRHLTSRVPPKGIIILTTTHIGIVEGLFLKAWALNLGLRVPRCRQDLQAVNFSPTVAQGEYFAVPNLKVPPVANPTLQAAPKPKP